MEEIICKLRDNIMAFTLMKEELLLERSLKNMQRNLKKKNL
jgi:hypothetical protein